jgi:nifR3 family TIM-barrel protein
MLPSPRPIDIGGQPVWPPVVLAPMAGVTNVAYRAICQRFGATLTVNEMVTARALVEGNPKTMRMLQFGDEPIRSMQLYGVDPTTMAQAVRRCVDEFGVAHIDLNFGCPVPKVTRHGGGAALPFKRPLLRAILAAAVAAAGKVPVSAKFRMGIDAAHLTFHDSGRIAQEEGCAWVALHARTADELYSGSAHWDAIAELVHELTIPVLGNGDIWHAADAVQMMNNTGCAGVVIGRGCLGNPWLFRDLAGLFQGEPVQAPPLLGEVVDVMVEHLARLVAWAGPHLGVREFRKHTGWYLKGYPVGSELRSELHRLEDQVSVVAALGALDPKMARTPGAQHAKRGHVRGPRPVSLPQGWLDDPCAITTLDPAAESASSGG